MFMSSSNNEFTHSRQENTTTSVSDTNMASISIEAQQQQKNSIFASEGRLKGLCSQGTSFRDRGH